MRRLFAAILTIAAAAGCTEGAIEGAMEDSTEQEAVMFSTESVASRVYVDTTDGNTKWSAGDAVGISCSGDTQNVKYTASIASDVTTFSYSDDTKDQHLLPRTTSATYAAYYPYQSEGSTYTSDVRDQSDLLAIDMLVAGGVTASESSPSVSFSFTHALAKLSFTIGANNTLQSSDLEGLKVTLSGVTTIAELNYDGSKITSSSPTTGEISLNVSADGTLAEAVINPYDISSGTLLFVLKNGEVHSISFSLADVTAGTKYSYNLDLGYDVPIISSSPTITNWGTGSTLSVNAEEADIIYDKDSDIYLIRTSIGLCAFASLVNGTAIDSRAITYNLDADTSTSPRTSIDGKLTCSVDFADVNTTWTRIGGTYDVDSGNDLRYNGKFDGDGYEIQNLTATGTSQLALFGFLGTSGVICNLGVTGSVTSSYDGGTASQTAGIVANNYGYVINCYNEATIRGEQNVGGIAGYNEGSIINCYNLGSVTSTEESTSFTNINVGGIAAVNVGTLQNGYSTGSVTAVASNKYVGGVVGNNFYNSGTAGTISNYFTSESNSIGKADSSGNSDTANCKTEEYLRSSDFVTTLNDYVSTSLTDPDISPCSWSDIDGRYPTLIFE